MKALLLIFLSCFPFVNANTINEKPIASKIEKVTVYLEGATVHRTGTINLTSGEHTLLFKNLSPDIDEKSIQISGLSGASILSLNFHLNSLEKKEVSEEYQALEQTIATLKLNQTIKISELEGIKEELVLLRNNQRINSDATDLVLEKVREMAIYYRERISEIRTQTYQLGLEIEEFNKRIDDHRSELLRLNDAKSENRGEIVLKLSVKKAQNLRLNVKYNISDAGWFPIYDIRAKNISSPIEMTYKANVYQQSGVDWKGVSIVLSTGDPNTNNIKPTLPTKYLNFTNASYVAPSAVPSQIYKYNPTIRTVSGTVVDDAGLPISGVNVIVTGTSNGTQTDFAGSYTLQNITGRELSFSSLGFKSYAQPVYASTINVSMVTDASALSEVVVTGYSSRRKRSSENLSEMLAGKAAGVNITGSAGAANKVIIRGANSFSGHNNALYVIDGVPVSKAEMSFLGGNSDSFNDINLDPDNIESVDILKGLAATSIYGSAGGDGVILITTKNGQGMKLSSGNSKSVGITNTKFEIKETYNIDSNAEITVIEIDQFNLPAVYQHCVAPELNENVFLTATINNWEQFDLLQGEANVYFEEAYAGKTLIDPMATADSLNISLGIDPNIVVKRQRLNNFKSKSFLGSNRLVSNGFIIEVKNNKSTTVNLLIQDRIPISQNKEIKISEIETDNAEYSKDKGLLKWKLLLAPNEGVKKKFSYEVKYPKYKRINL